MRLNPSVKQNFIPLFDMCSVLLIAVLTLCAGTAAQAQGFTSPSAKPGGSPPQTSPSQMAPSEAMPSGEATAGPAKKATAKELEAAFKQTDTNGDGKLSKKEAEAFQELLQLFTEIDTDKDGFVSSKEFKIASGG